ncbi:MAG TPA: hypothetical protein VN631_05110 [Negativicutes bacterium]|nr:hypothetical protein [Negativicutes bacterium]
MRKIIAIILIAALCVSMFTACVEKQIEAATPTTNPEAVTDESTATEEPAVVGTPAPTEKDYARLITQVPAGADLETAVRLENRNCKHIQAMKVLFADDSYKAYFKAVTNLKKNPTAETLTAALEAREALVQVNTIADKLWFIWDGTTMPVVDGESFTEEELDKSQMFGYGFEPFAIKYLVADQSKCKGNIIAVSGGAYLVWSNGSEGYPAAQVFNDLGYNYFLLQRRVGPYSPEDIYMDYQRFVRVVKYHAETENYGGQDMYAALGWSGGGGTILGGSVNELYGLLNPTKYDAEYVPDALDAISSDVDVELVIYGAHGGITTKDNANLPAFYICVGSEDGTGPEDSTKLYNQALEAGSPAMLYIVEGAPHGFGVGLPPAAGANVPGTELWPAQADEFMQANLGWQKNG